jgi:hypothetical protein
MRSTWNRMNRLIFAGCALWIAAGPVAAAEMPVRAVVKGRLVATPTGAGEAEAVQLDSGLTASLLKLKPGSSVAVADWPVAPGIRQEVELTRVEIYAPGAKIVKIENGRAVELPRSRHAFFHGRSVDDLETRLVIAVDPDTRTLEGTAYTRAGRRDLKPAKSGEYLVSTAEAALEKSGQEPSWNCDQEQSVAVREPLDLSGTPAAKALGTVTGKAVTLQTATIAVDTDNELMSLKFANNSTAATNYIANLFANMNVMYERDLQVRLLQGYTVLRPSTTADPWVQTSTGSQLTEFTNYWSAGCNGTCASVSRAAAMLLSGKSTSNFSAAGVAWVDQLCSTSHGYSVSQVFLFAQDTSANDGPLVGHELGHNFGSPHTHCYAPPIDTCYNGEACYTGPQSCPAAQTINGLTNVTGTVMSYCHLTGCGTTAVFHPRSVTLIAPKIAAKAGICIFPLGAANALFSNGFEAGNTLLWQ